MNNIKLTSDIGRISLKIAIRNNRFYNLTANQQKTFIIIYFIPILQDILDDNDRRFQNILLKYVNFLIAKFITDDDLKKV